MVAQFQRVKTLIKSSAQRRNNKPDFGYSQHFLRGSLFHIQNLTSQRQNRLETPFPSLLGGTAGGITFHQVQFAQRRVFFRTIGQFAG